MTEQPPKQGEPGFGRDEDMEPTRHRDRPAEADLDATRKKARQDPIHYAPDPDAEPDKS